MTDIPNSIWVDSEVLAVGIRTVAPLAAMLLFAAAIASSLRLVEGSLPELLAPLA